MVASGTVAGSAVVVAVAAATAEAPLEHNFRYPRIRELTLDNDGIALGAEGLSFSFSSLRFQKPGNRR